MAKNTAKVAVETAAQNEGHPLTKSHRLISTKNVDYNNLTAIESVAMSLTLGLSVFYGALYAVTNGIVA